VITFPVWGFGASDGAPDPQKPTSTLKIKHGLSRPTVYIHVIKLKAMKKLLALVLVALVLTSCGVRVKGTCSGNKTMAFYGGYSRKAFTK
jgi:hypothetical protein